jgi:hypothetical protein
MPMPWLQLFDLLVNLTDILRMRGSRSRGLSERRKGRPRRLLEGRLAGLVAGAMDEVFARDRAREERIRARIQEERRERERARQVERVQRQGDREVGRLRLIAGLAVLSWIATVLLAVAQASTGTGVAPRIFLGFGGLLQLWALVSSLVAQSGLSAALARYTDPDRHAPDAGVNAVMAPWLLVASLAFIGVAALLM